MKLLRKMVFATALILPLAACLGNSASTPSVSRDAVATRANLSPEAIRLQSVNLELISLEEQQKAAKDRRRNFMLQAGLIGAVGGGVAGGILCNIRGCSDDQRNVAVIGGAAAGGAAGARVGRNQADRQNAAASAENELNKRIKIAGSQLTETQNARKRAGKIARFHAQKLSKLKAEVAAGRAKRAQLTAARADARLDAQQVKATVAAMEDTSDSLKPSGSKNTRLAQRKSQVDSELEATEKAYSALRKSISRSAL